MKYVEGFEIHLVSSLTMGMTKDYCICCFSCIAVFLKKPAPGELKWLSQLANISLFADKLYQNYWPWIIIVFNYDLEP